MKKKYYQELVNWKRTWRLLFRAICFPIERSTETEARNVFQLNSLYPDKVIKFEIKLTIQGKIIAR